MSRIVLLHGAPRHLGGWRRDVPDHRDAECAAPLLLSLAGQPVLTSFDGACVRPPIRDQGPEGSCTGHGGRNGYMALPLREGLAAPDRSPQFIYDAARMLEGTPLAEDSGAQVRDVVRALYHYGACSETIFPYVPANRTVTPPPEVFADAAQHKVSMSKGGYYNFPDRDLDSIKRSIAQRYPVIFGFTCYTSLESPDVARTGLIPFPAKGERKVGGHCVPADSFDDDLVIGNDRGALIIANSWGKTVGGLYVNRRWTIGGGGLYALPYRYVLTGNACSFWSIRREAI